MNWSAALVSKRAKSSFTGAAATIFLRRSTSRVLSVSTSPEECSSMDATMLGQAVFQIGRAHVCSSDLIGVHGSRSDNLLATIHFARLKRVDLAGGMLIDGCNDAGASGFPRIEMQQEWAVQVFLIIQTSLALTLVIEVVKPKARTIQRIGVVSEVQAGQIRIRFHSRHTRPLFHLAIDRVIGVCGVVIIAKRNQWSNLE